VVVEVSKTGWPTLARVALGCQGRASHLGSDDTDPSKSDCAFRVGGGAEPAL